MGTGNFVSRAAQLAPLRDSAAVAEKRAAVQETGLHSPRPSPQGFLDFHGALSAQGFCGLAVGETDRAVPLRCLAVFPGTLPGHAAHIAQPLHPLAAWRGEINFPETAPHLEALKAGE